MRKNDKEFREETVKLSDEAGVKQAAAQLGIPYNSLAEWRQKRKAYGDHAFVGSGIRARFIWPRTSAGSCGRTPSCARPTRY